MNSTIQIQNACLAYNGLILFDHLNLTLSEGKITCLLGQSGIGKTALLRIIANLITPETTTSFKGKIISQFNDNLANYIAYMAQTDLLFPWLNALENTLIGSQLRGKNYQKNKLIAKKLFHQLGLSTTENQYPHQLSGGMRQRVALIRTLLEDKPIILMDEPFSALDAITRFELQNLALELLNNKTVLLVTHDIMEALRIADEIYIMSGKPATLSTHLSLDTPKPRSLADPLVIEYQELLFETLMVAK